MLEGGGEPTPTLKVTDSLYTGKPRRSIPSPVTRYKVFGRRMFDTTPGGRFRCRLCRHLFKLDSLAGHYMTEIRKTEASVLALRLDALNTHRRKRQLLRESRWRYRQAEGAGVDVER